MKSKILFILVIIVLILAIGTVSADEFNASDVNVTFPEKVYQEAPANISVDFPDTPQGKLKATVDDVEIYNGNITNKSVKIPIRIPESKGLVVIGRNVDYTAHIINVFYNEQLLNSSHILKVMKFKPDHDYFFSIDEVLKDDKSNYQVPSIVFPYSANGTVDLYVDGIFSDTLKTHTFTFINMTKLNTLDLGNHTLQLKYSGDDYYLASDKSYNFTVVDMLIHIPRHIVLEHDDCLTAKIINNTDGNLEVFFDGKLIISKKLDKNGEFLESLFKYVTCGNHTIEVKYISKNFSKTKKVVSNVSYYVDFFSWVMTYGEDNEVIIIVPTDFKKDWISIDVDGVKIEKFTIDNSGWIDINVSKLDAGNHTLNFYFNGNGKYYSWNESFNFTIKYGIIVPDYIWGKYSKVTLTLPQSAKGTLEVYIDNKIYKSQKLSKGKASISLSQIERGNHDIFARYIGDDFNVSEVNSTFYVEPKIKIKADNMKIIYSQSGKYKTFISNEDGAVEDYYVSFKIGKKSFETYTNEKGIASVKLPKLTPGKYKITVMCGESKLTKKLTVKHMISFKSVKVKKSAKKLVLTVKLAKKLKGKKITFKFNGKKYTAKTNKKGVAKVTIKKSALKKLKVGKKIKYQASYLKDTIKYTVNVKK